MYDWTIFTYVSTESTKAQISLKIHQDI